MLVYDAPMPEVREQTGHSRELRDRLRERREKLGLHQKAVGELIGRTGASVSAYERFEQHPPVDVFAAWARSLGMRLIVDLDDSERVPVAVSPDLVETVRALNRLSTDDREIVARLITALPTMSRRERRILAGDLEDFERPKTEE